MVAGGSALVSISTIVTAAASVPDSSTLIKVFYFIKPINKGCSVDIFVKSASDLKASLTPNVLITSVKSILDSIVKRGK